MWRLRRAATIETGLFEIQANRLSDFRQARQVQPAARDVIHAMFGGSNSVGFGRDPASPSRMNTTEVASSSAPKSLELLVDPTVEIARCFLRLANLPNYALDRLSRYEVTLWRQIGQILFALDSLDRRKPQERRRGLLVGSQKEPPAGERDQF
jgi:hypothetical protein